MKHILQIKIHAKIYKQKICEKNLQTIRIYSVVLMYRYGWTKILVNVKENPYTDTTNVQSLPYLWIFTTIIANIGQPHIIYMCVEQFSHHQACIPGPTVFTSLAELYTLHFCFRDLMHNIYIYSCNCRCSLLTRGGSRICG